MTIKHYNTNNGFTLIELLIYIMLFGIFSITVYAVFFSSMNTYKVNSRSVDLRQNLRASLEFIAGELREAGNAGYDFTNFEKGTAEVGFTSALRNSVTFSTDVDADGVATVTQYSLAAASDADNDGVVDTGTSNLVRTIDVLAPETVTDDVEAIQFAYAFDGNGDNQLDFVDANGDGLSDTDETIWAYDSDDDGQLDTQLDGTAIPAGVVGIDKIRVVRVWILGRTSTTLNKSKDTNTYTLGGVSVSGNNDTFKRYLLSTTVKCRNMTL